MPRADARAVEWDLLRDATSSCARFAGYDMDRDGTLEIEAIRAHSRLSASPEDAAGKPLVVVLIEERLLAAPSEGADLRPALATYAGDLAAEGYNALAIGVRLYRGPRHQDGRTVLALREFLRDVRRTHPELQAVVLVGDLPETFLVRQYNWWLKQAVTLRAGTPQAATYGEKGGVDYLRSVPEPVALRTDLILGDLDGRWEDLYHGAAEDVPYLYAVYLRGREAASEAADDTEEGAIRFEDFFLVQDGRYHVARRPGGKPIVLPEPPDDAECSPDDLTLPNPLARPDIWVSRLNARHASAVPDPALVDRDGTHLLDADGVPQKLTFDSPEKTPSPHSFWVPSEVVERKMLAGWLELRHRFRVGEFRDAWKPASIGTGWGSSIPACRESFAEWTSFEQPGYDIEREDVNLREVVDWFARPAVARAMKAHGDPWGCSWANAPDVAALEQSVGPVLYNWKREGATLTPGISSPGKLDFAITRSLYESGKAPLTPAVWLYTACEGTAPQGGAELPYSDPAYGRWQGAEAIVFHLGALGLIGRSKVFYDEPSEMWKTLGEGGSMGDVWRHYFDLEAADPNAVRDNGIGCKRAYFWYVAGDCTVRLHPEP